MAEDAPIVEMRAPFVDEIVAREVADALNMWFRWILTGSEDPVPAAFESLGVETTDYAWSLEDDVDWELGPHARVYATEVRISLGTHETHLHLSGLLRRLGALSVRCLRDGEF
ncbi:MAG: hypothetical protein O2894_09020 [Planctomycetota bacterium]|nr:hypothetical protein [Planctomycetota bacterium]